MTLQVRFSKLLVQYSFCSSSLSTPAHKTGINKYFSLAAQTHFLRKWALQCTNNSVLRSVNFLESCFLVSQSVDDLHHILISDNIDHADEACHRFSRHSGILSSSRINTPHSLPLTPDSCVWFHPELTGRRIKSGEIKNVVLQSVLSRVMGWTGRTFVFCQGLHHCLGL